MGEREHGTRAKYVHEQCRCIPCSYANRRYARANELARVYGTVDLVPAEPVRAHLRRLSRAGVGYKQAAKVAGVSTSSTAKILGEVSVRVRSATAAALLAVTVADVADNQKVDAAQTWVFVRELLELGYPKAWISGHIGQGGRALQLGRDRVTRRNADAVRALRITTGQMRYDVRANLTVADEARMTGRQAALLQRISRSPS